MEIQFERDYLTGAKIKVVGIGGGGSNAVDNLLDAGLRGVEFYVLNTDVQALERSKAPNKIQIGKDITRGRGAGSDPAIGRKAAEAAKTEIEKILEGSDMVFITAGLGGGTGTGAAPVVAQIARDMNILTVAVVSLPFKFEGHRRAQNAAKGLDELRQFVDACTVVNNERLSKVIEPRTPLPEALKIANDVLTMAVTSVSEVINVPGIINVEFSDVETIMRGTGGAVIGFGAGKGDKRAIDAVKKARENQLLDLVDIRGAKGILICFTGGPDLTLQEVSEACDVVYQEADPQANIIFGAVVDEKMKDEVRVTIIATGLDRTSSDFPGHPFANDGLDTPTPHFPRESSPPPPRSSTNLSMSTEPTKEPKESKEASLAASTGHSEPSPGSSGDRSAAKTPASSISFVSDDEHKPAPTTEPSSPAPGTTKPTDPFEVPTFLRRGPRYGL